LSLLPTTNQYWCHSRKQGHDPDPCRTKCHNHWVTRQTPYSLGHWSHINMILSLQMVFKFVKFVHSIQCGSIDGKEVCFLCDPKQEVTCNLPSIFQKNFQSKQLKIKMWCINWTVSQRNILTSNFDHTLASVHFCRHKTTIVYYS
jgi:hypothetical protein